MINHMIPRIGQQVYIYVGEPLDISDIVDEYNLLSDEEKETQAYVFFFFLVH